MKDLVDRLMGRDPAQRFMFIQNRAADIDPELIDAWHCARPPGRTSRLPRRAALLIV